MEGRARALTSGEAYDVRKLQFTEMILNWMQNALKHKSVLYNVRFV